ncbi:hypothetical protein COO60DRAFT_216694 [Scenedesmus sp. NREL 46B-D3]|nr:hypothetical protein COO60DRAFT_216694 [Scenedesmus sp. NREL 46B-D3]
MSAKLLEYAVDEQCIDISRQQLQLIHSIISGTRGGSSSSSSMRQQWDCSDSPWLLQIVANATNGVDVDKIDYLQRDALMTGVGQVYNFTELLRNCRVVDGELCFHQSQQDRLAGLFRARAAMHARVYQHRSAKAAELMVVDALLAADPVLGISRDADDPEAFLTLDDSLLGEIKRAARRSPQCPHLAAAAAILRRLDCRDLYPWVGEAAVPDQFVLERGEAACALSAADVAGHQDSSLGAGLSEQDLRVSSMKIDCGKGNCDPLDHTKLYGDSSSSSSSSSSTWLASQGIARPATFMQRKCGLRSRARRRRALAATYTSAAMTAAALPGARRGSSSNSRSQARLLAIQQQQQACLRQAAAAAAAAAPRA